MTPTDKDIDNFFAALKDYDSNMLTILEFENQIKKVQGKFEENE